MCRPYMIVDLLLPLIEKQYIFGSWSSQMLLAVKTQPCQTASSSFRAWSLCTDQWLNMLGRKWKEKSLEPNLWLRKSLPPNPPRLVVLINELNAFSSSLALHPHLVTHFPYLSSSPSSLIHPNLPLRLRHHHWHHRLPLHWHCYRNHCPPHSTHR